MTSHLSKSPRSRLLPDRACREVTDDYASCPRRTMSADRKVGCVAPKHVMSGVKPTEKNGLFQGSHVVPDDCNLLVDRLPSHTGQSRMTPAAIASRRRGMTGVVSVIPVAKNTLRVRIAPIEVSVTTPP